MNIESDHIPQLVQEIINYYLWKSQMDQVNRDYYFFYQPVESQKHSIVIRGLRTTYNFRGLTAYFYREQTNTSQKFPPRSRISDKFGTVLPLRVPKRYLWSQGG